MLILNDEIIKKKTEGCTFQNNIMLILNPLFVLEQLSIEQISKQHYVDIKQLIGTTRQNVLSNFKTTLC